MKKITALAFFLFITSFLLSQKAYASSFTSSYIRLNNQSANSSLSGTVCAQPSSPTAGVESYVSVTFPQSFTISQNTSDWNTDIVGLPQGATAWPGAVQPVQSVSGKTVTFKSQNLTSAILYCFDFTTSNSTTGTAADSQTGTITTLNNSFSTIDSTAYALSILSNDQIQVTASIQPAISDLPITLTSLTSGSQFSQGTTLNYKITYGSNTSYSVPLTIQAQWSQGTVNGSPSPSVDVVDYVIGSATNAFSNTPAVVDTQNRTITWTISSFPGHTLNDTVNFSLETNDNYTGGNNVSFTVSARAISGSTVTPDNSVTQNYLYAAAVASLATPTPSATPNPAGIIPPKPSLSFSDISISSISQNSAGISVTRTVPSTLKVLYGTSTDSLSQSITTLTAEKQTLVSLSGLIPDKDYYFKIIATDAKGNSISSDIYTFTTATVSQAPSVDNESLVVTSQNNVLVNPSINASLTSGNNNLNKNVIVIPTSTNFQIQFSLKKNTSVRNVQAIIRPKVLGANTFSLIPEVDASTDSVDLIEIQPGVFTGRLKSKPNPGKYEIFVRVIDFNGNIEEEKIADLTVISQFTIFDEKTKKPVEGARILFYLFNDKAKTYQIISPEVLSFSNPQFSDLDGTVNLVLPYGKYRADISSITYSPKTIEFEVSPNSENYPTIFLTPRATSPINLIEYFTNTFIDAMSANKEYLIAHTASNRLFDLLTSAALLIFILSLFISFSERTHVPFTSIPYFFYAKMRLLIYKKKAQICIGKVVNSDEKPLSKANVYVIDADRNKILAHLKTNRLGEFYFNKLQAENFKISVMKKGFSPTPLFEYSRESFEKELVIKIEKEKDYIKPLHEIWSIYFGDLIGVVFEFFLVAALIAQIFFIFTFGFLRIAPFLLISTSNIILFFLFLYRPKGLYIEEM